MRFTQIQVKGYRALADVTFDLHPLTVMIGPNGCGKTSLLEIFQLLKETAQGRLGDAIAAVGGFNALLAHFSDIPSRMEVALQVDVASPLSPEPVSYHLALEPWAVGYRIAFENLERQTGINASEPYRYIETGNDAKRSVVAEGKIRPREIYPYGQESALVMLSRNDESGVFVDTLKNILSLGPLEVSPRAPVRLPQALTPASQPGRNGEALFAALYNLRDSSAARASYDRIDETLRLAFSDFDHLELPVVGAGQITLAWHQKNLTIPLYPNQLSEGTLRFLWLTTVLLSPEPPPLILIDEPEVSLHPELLKILAALLQDASARTQVMVATHSSDLIRWLQPDEVVVVDKVDGKAMFTWASDPSLNLGEWLKEYTLSDLWLMGNLGGRP